MLDFSNAEEQKEFVQGPVPAGSIVVLQMEVLAPTPESAAPDNPLIYVSQHGLRQIRCKFEVAEGTYKGVYFRQNITLPYNAQNIHLSPGQEVACRIGASQLKAICEAANKIPKINNVGDFNGYTFPAKLKLNKRPYEKDGETYWNNEIALIIIPKMPEYNEIRQKREIINPNGAICGKIENAQVNQSSQTNQVNQNNSYVGQNDIDRDVVPF